MAVKIRLTRIGRHKDPFYRIVAADARYARDGRFIEQIGYIDPHKDIKEAVVNEQVALKWLHQGAVPTDTVKSILKAKGIMEKFDAEKREEAKK